MQARLTGSFLEDGLRKKRACQLQIPNVGTKSKQSHFVSFEHLFSYQEERRNHVQSYKLRKYCSIFGFLTRDTLDMFMEVFLPTVTKCLSKGGHVIVKFSLYYCIFFKVLIYKQNLIECPFC